MNLKSAISLAALSLVLGLSACGSSDESDAAADTTNPDLPVVKVGIIYPEGSASGDFPSMPAVLNASVAAVNSRGGFNGHQVETVICNDKAVATESVTCARKMVNEGVVAVVGGFSLNDLQIQEILDDAGIPMVGFAPNSGPVFNAKNVYLPQAPFASTYDVLIAYAVKSSLTPMAVAMGDNPVGQQYADSLEQAFNQYSDSTGGFSGKVPVAADTTDYALVAGSIDGGSSPKSMLALLPPSSVVGVVSALEARGTGIAAYLNGSPLTSDDIAAIGNGISKMVLGSPTPPLQDASLQQFRDEMKAFGNEDAQADKLSPAAIPAWLAVQALEQVTAEMDDVTAATLTAALDSAKDIDMGGVVPPWTPSAEGPEGMSRVSNPAIWLIGYDDGEPMALYDSAVMADEILSGEVSVELPPATEDAMN